MGTSGVFIFKQVQAITSRLCLVYERGFRVTTYFSSTMRVLKIIMFDKCDLFHLFLLVNLAA